VDSTAKVPTIGSRAACPGPGVANFIHASIIAASSADIVPFAGSCPATGSAAMLATRQITTRTSSFFMSRPSRRDYTSQLLVVRDAHPGAGRRLALLDGEKLYLEDERRVGPITRPAPRSPYASSGGMKSCHLNRPS